MEAGDEMRSRWLAPYSAVPPKLNWLMAVVFLVAGAVQLADGTYTVETVGGVVCLAFGVLYAVSALVVQVRGGPDGN